MFVACIVDGPVAITKAGDAVRLFAPGFLNLDFERLQAAFLAADNIVAGMVRLDGSCDRSALPTGPLLRRAMMLGATALIIAHNHPAGDPAPSAADVAATKRLACSGALVGVRLVDHLIFGDGRWESFRALGLL